MIRQAFKFVGLPKIGRNYFSAIQQHKPTPVQLKAQKEGIMMKKQLDYKYKLINSSPNDSVDAIQNNFIALKSKLNSKHFYMPHKKQYLLMLDQAYEDIIKIHEDYSLIEITKPKGNLSKQQQITHELQKIKFSKKIALYQTYEFAAISLILIIAIEIFLEQYDLKGQQKMNVTSNFNFILFFQQIYNSFVNKLKKLSRLDLLDQIKNPSEIREIIETKLTNRKKNIQQVNNKLI